MAHAFSLHEKWQVIACLKHSVVMQCNANQLQGQFILPKWDWSVIRLKWRTSKVTKKGDFWKSAWQQTYLLHHSEHVWSQFWNEGQATQKPKGEFLKNRIAANLILSYSLPTISLLSMTWVAFWHYHPTVLVLRMAHWIWKETKQESGTARPGNMFGCCLVALHFLWAILSTSTVESMRCHLWNFLCSNHVSSPIINLRHGIQMNLIKNRPTELTLHECCT